MIRRLFRWPLMSASLFAMWLLLNRSVAPGQILLGAVLALALPRLTAKLRPTAVRVRRPWVALRLLATVLWDSFLSNLAVARVILGGRERRHRSGFVEIPLELRDPHGLSMLAAILTGIPGTVWCELSDDGSTLTIHVLDLQQEEDWVRTVKDRYERPLREIFE
ncbi:Na+/H+ antiporter subunit E [Pigmentiphaga soli]|uniref:Na+/H+ antiporter subunit E n=1 Tax=Pigmentiphaga soli TaxID=1007095 RepID=A0ABP8GJJ5_9BURK